MSFHDFFRNGHAHAGAMSIELVSVRPLEGLKHPTQIVRMDSNTVVSNEKDRVGVTALVKSDLNVNL